MNRRWTAGGVIENYRPLRRSLVTRLRRLLGREKRYVVTFPGEPDFSTVVWEPNRESEAE